jgi:hypothetical protein
MQLLSFSPQKDFLSLNEPNAKALELAFKDAPGPLRVLCACGASRLGKSTMLLLVLRHLLGDDWANKIKLDDVFRTGASTEAVTVGVWVHGTPITLPDGGTLIVVDTEGNSQGNPLFTLMLSCVVASVASLVLYMTDDGNLTNASISALSSMAGAHFMSKHKWNQVGAITSDCKLVIIQTQDEDPLPDVGRVKQQLARVQAFRGEELNAARELIKEVWGEAGAGRLMYEPIFVPSQKDLDLLAQTVGQPPKVLRSVPDLRPQGSSAFGDCVRQMLPRLAIAIPKSSPFKTFNNFVVALRAVLHNISVDPLLKDVQGKPDSQRLCAAVDTYRLDIAKTLLSQACGRVDTILRQAERSALEIVDRHRDPKQPIAAAVDAANQFLPRAQWQASVTHPALKPEVNAENTRRLDEHIDKHVAAVTARVDKEKVARIASLEAEAEVAKLRRADAEARKLGKQSAKLRASIPHRCPTLPGFRSANDYDLPQFYECIRFVECRGTMYVVSPHRNANPLIGFHVFKYKPDQAEWDDTPLGGNFALPSPGDVAGLPQCYQTLRVVSCLGKIYLCYRDPSFGLYLFVFDPETTRWTPCTHLQQEICGSTPDCEEFYSTLRFVECSGLLYLVCRNTISGFALFSYDPMRSVWARLPSLTTVGVADDLSVHGVYQTVGLTECNRRLYLTMRHRAVGLQVHCFDPAAGQWNAHPLPACEGVLIETAGGPAIGPEYYTTIKVIASNGKLFATFRTGVLISLFCFDPRNGFWAAPPNRRGSADFVFGLTSADGYDAPEYYSTCRLAAVGKKLFLVCRGPKLIRLATHPEQQVEFTRGVHFFCFDTERLEWLGELRGIEADFASPDGFDAEDSYRTFDAVVSGEALLTACRYEGGIKLYSYRPFPLA